MFAHVGRLLIAGHAVMLVSTLGCSQSDGATASAGANATGGQTAGGGAGARAMSGASGDQAGTVSTSGGVTGHTAGAPSGGAAGTLASGGADNGGADNGGADNGGAGSAGTVGSAGTNNSAGTGNVSGAAGTTGNSAAGASNGGSAGAGGKSNGASNGTDKVTIWMAGDSTMADNGNTCPIGWGKEFQVHFNANAQVVNNAVSGTTVRSWLYDVTSTLGSDGDCTLSSSAPQAHWTSIANNMKAGDYLFIQFGINDTTSATCPKHVSYATFKQLFGMMAQAAQAKGAQPIFVTAVSSISCSGSMAQGTRGGYAMATKEAAAQYNVPVIDLEQLSVALYTSLGFCPSTDTPATFTANTPIGRFFCNDHTHFEASGATQIANLVAKALRDQGFGLANYLVQ